MRTKPLLTDQHFDYIIIGAGSAGCVVAGQLADKTDARILVIEAGPTERHPYVQVPLGYGLLFHDKLRNYGYSTIAEENLKGRRIYYPRGKVVGGSGSINAMVYLRGLAQDFDEWTSLGFDGWAWDSVKPEFEKLESRQRGEFGIPVSSDRAQCHEFTSHFETAAAEAGLHSCRDMNGDDPEGLGLYQTNIRSGFRRTSADVFLRPRLTRNRVQLATNTRVTRLLCETVDGSTKAIGVEIAGQKTANREEPSESESNGAASESESNKAGRIFARRGVILTAGAINTPQLLQISGIGDKRQLDQHGIPTIVDNQHVGAHLRDHIGVSYYYKSRDKTLNSQLHTAPAKAWQILRYVATRTGPIANSVNQYGGLLRSSANMTAPDQQLYLNAASYTEARTANGLEVQTDPFSAFTLCFQPAKPTSEGSVRLASRHITDAPLIHLNALSTSKDRTAVIAGAKLIRRLVQTPALQSQIVDNLSPCPTQLTDEEILEDFRERASTVFHPCGSCKMGNSAADGVVDQMGSLFGVQQLYIADASIFPTIPSGNINATTMMVAQKISASILKNDLIAQ